MREGEDERGTGWETDWMREGLDESCYVRDENDETTVEVEQTRGLKSQKGIINNAFRDMSRRRNAAISKQSAFRISADIRYSFSHNFQDSSPSIFFVFPSFLLKNCALWRTSYGLIPDNPYLTRMCFEISSRCFFHIFTFFVEKKCAWKTTKHFASLLATAP